MKYPNSSESRPYRGTVIPTSFWFPTELNNVNQPQNFEQVCLLRAFQDGGHLYSEKPAGTGRLANKDQPQGCILQYSLTPITSEIPSVLIPREILPLHLSSFGHLFSPMDIHQDFEVCPESSVPEGVWMIAYIGNIRTSHNRVQVSSLRILAGFGTLLRILGVHHQYRKVCVYTRPDYSISVSHSRLNQYGAMTTPCQDKAGLSG